MRIPGRYRPRLLATFPGPDEMRLEVDVSPLRELRLLLAGHVAALEGEITAAEAREGRGDAP